MLKVEEDAIPLTGLAARVVVKVSSGVEVAVSCASLEFAGVKVLAVAESAACDMDAFSEFRKAVTSNADSGFCGLASGAMLKARLAPDLRKRTVSGVYSVPTVVGDGIESPEREPSEPWLPLRLITTGGLAADDMFLISSQITRRIMGASKR